MRDFWLDIKQDPLSLFSLPEVLLFGLAGVLLVFALGRFGLLRRPNRWHARAVSLYYLYLPLAFLVIGLSCSLLGTLEKSLLRSSENARAAITAFSVETANAVWKDVTLRLSGEHIPFADLCVTVRRGYADRYAEQLKEQRLPILAPLAKVIQDGLAADLALAAEEMLAVRPGEEELVEISRLQPIWGTTIVAAMQDGLAVTLLQKHIRMAISSAYRQAAVLALELLAFPVLEILVFLCLPPLFTPAQRPCAGP